MPSKNKHVNSKVQNELPQTIAPTNVISRKQNAEKEPLQEILQKQ